MSLINKMLADLESRVANVKDQPETKPVLDGLHSVEKPGNKAKMIRIGVISAVLVGSLAVGATRFWPMLVPLAPTLLAKQNAAAVPKGTDSTKAEPHAEEPSAVVRHVDDSQETLGAIGQDAMPGHDSGMSATPADNGLGGMDSGTDGGTAVDPKLMAMENGGAAPPVSIPPSLSSDAVDSAPKPTEAKKPDMMSAKMDDGMQSALPSTMTPIAPQPIAEHNIHAIPPTKSAGESATAMAKSQKASMLVDDAVAATSNTNAAAPNVHEPKSSKPMAVATPSKLTPNSADKPDDSDASLDLEPPMTGPAADPPVEHAMSEEMLATATPAQTKKIEMPTLHKPIAAVTDVGSPPTVTASAAPVDHATASKAAGEVLADRSYRSGVEYVNQGRMAEGEERFRTALNHKPDHADARLALVGLLMNQQRVLEAQVILEDGQSRDSFNDQLAQALARIYVDFGLEDRALRVLEKHKNEGVENADFMATLAVLYQRQGRFNESAAAYRVALAKRAGEGRWWLGLGLALESTQQWHAASMAYAQAVNSAALPATLLSYAEKRLAEVRLKAK